MDPSAFHDHGRGVCHFAAVGICAALLMTYIYFYLTYAKETSGSARET